MRVFWAAWMCLLVMSGGVESVLWAGAEDGNSGDRDAPRGPTLIYNVYDLQNMSNNLSGSYELANDIDASGTRTWNSGAGFVPVGNTSIGFAGGLDGKNYTIRGLFINRPATNFVGLFGWVDCGSLKNIGLLNNDVCGHDFVGGFSGGFGDGTVNDSFATGTVTGDECVGGLVGIFNSHGTLNNSYADMNVIGNWYVGGLVGENEGTLNNSYANGNVTGNEGDVGGLVGVNREGTLSNSYTTGNVTGGYTVGGIVGTNLGMVTDSHAFGTVNGTERDAGGIAGLNFGTVKDSNVTGNVTGNDTVGGLVGMNYGVVNNSRSTVNVIGTGNTVGGLVGENSNFCTVNNSHATGTVTGAWGNYGGLIGVNRGTVCNSRATGNVTGGGGVGGLVGLNDEGSLSRSHSSGNVAGKSNIGGLVGSNWEGIVNTSFSTGNVTGIDSVGGLVGDNEFGTVNNTYATGSVSGTWFAGGLVGYNEVCGTVSNSHAIGMVIGTDYIGGFAGADSGTVSGCFWDKETSGQGSSAGGTGKSTADMKLRSTFTKAGWDFTRVWGMMENVTYPLLKWQDGESPTTDAGPDQTIDEDTLLTFNGSRSSDNSGLLNWTWSFIDGRPITLHRACPMYRFNNPGVFVVTLNVTDAVGNWDMDSTNITVNDITPPSADAGSNQIVDEGKEVTFDGSNCSDNVGVVNYTWTFTDRIPVTLHGARPTHRFDSPGLIMVTLNASDAAANWGTDTLVVTVNDMTAPVADAGPNRTIDEGTPLIFTGSGCSDNVGVVNFTWTFTDGAHVILYGVQPAYRFGNPGVFVVTLNVTDAAGNWDTDSMTVLVNDMTAPVADAGADQFIDEGTIMTFNGNGSSDNVGVVTYTWTFEVGSPVTLNGVGPTYLFENPGIFIVTLNVTDAADNWHTDTLTVTVMDITAPHANAGADLTVNEGSLVTFDGSKSSDNVEIINYTWTFSDTVAAIIFGIQPMYKFDNPGIFVVTLNVTDAAGNRGGDTVTITVKDVTPPVANAGQDQKIAFGTTIVLNASQSTDNVGIAKYAWDFIYDGKKKSLEGKDVSFKFEMGGVYEIALNVFDAASNMGNDTVIIIVVDTGIVTGTVLDAGGKPIEGAMVGVTASDGKAHATKTETNGSFSVEIYHGRFSWNISKSGYLRISGSSSVDPMGTTELDLSDRPLTKEGGEGPSDLPFMPLVAAVLMIVAVAGIGAYMFMRKRGK